MGGASIIYCAYYIEAMKKPLKVDAVISIDGQPKGAENVMRDASVSLFNGSGKQCLPFCLDILTQMAKKLKERGTPCRLQRGGEKVKIKTKTIRGKM